VDNTLTTFGPKSNEPAIGRGFVNSNFPLFPEDILVKNGAVFGGLIRRQFNKDLVAAVSSLFRVQLKARQSTEAKKISSVEYYVPGSYSCHRLREQLQRRGWVRLFFSWIAYPSYH
jgi:uncharacterized Fe-S cluster-containing radical SAM superfamily protein